MVVAVLGGQDVGHVGFQVADEVEQFDRRGVAEVGEAVLHPWGHEGVDLAVDEAVAFEGLQGLGQHLFADPFHPPAEGVEPGGPWASPARTRAPAPVRCSNTGREGQPRAKTSKGTSSSVASLVAGGRRTHILMLPSSQHYPVVGAFEKLALPWVANRRRHP